MGIIKCWSGGNAKQRTSIAVYYVLLYSHSLIRVTSQDEACVIPRDMSCRQAIPWLGNRRKSLLAGLKGPITYFSNALYAAQFPILTGAFSAASFGLAANSWLNLYAG